MDANELFSWSNPSLSSIPYHSLSSLYKLKNNIHLYRHVEEVATKKSIRFTF